MTPYVQSQIFRAFEQVIFKRAVRAVSYIGEWGFELRCHELARAVNRLLDVPAMSVVDGKLGYVEHSWLELILPVAETELHKSEYLDRAVAPQMVVGSKLGEVISYKRRVIIDVYTPGRLPQVQLIDPWPLLDPVYKPGEPRTDINERIVEAVYEEMRSNWLAIIR